MKWENLISPIRFGLEEFHEERADNRSEFLRDYDRLIFSSPFRRLQNKTQVFPLPGSVFVHNRLTHSLEVACVGRSLGNNVAIELIKQRPELATDSYLSEAGNIVSAACLAHDMGNPPFGHSGENAISSYFSEGKGIQLKPQLSDDEWTDITNFEGNANAFRLLSHQFKGRRPGGFAMTYATLASIVKYPYPSSAIKQKNKFGFFISEKENYKKIADKLGIIKTDEKASIYARHPFVWLVEAADDICYQIMDIEDAYKLKILSFERTKDLMLNFFEGNRLDRLRRNMNIMDDENEKIAYLRSSVIGKLIKECTAAFMANEQAILNGKLDEPLIDKTEQRACQAYKECSSVAYSKIYCSKQVLDVEMAGYKIIYTLIELMIDAVTNPDKSYSKLLIKRVSEQYEIDAPTLYGKIMAVLDYISGMTDVFALDLYRKIIGNSLPSV